MPLPAPELPEPAHADLDSMLSRKFGKEIANYFSGSPLNRVSFLRADHTFLSTAFKHPSTSFLVFSNLQPLFKSPTELAYVSYKDVVPLTGEDPYMQTEDEMISTYNSSKFTPQLIFLGLDERNKNGLLYKDHYKGAPYFAIDATPKGAIQSAAEELAKNLQERGYHFGEARMHMTLPAEEAAIYAEARHLLDWNARNPFCAQCGNPTLSRYSLRPHRAAPCATRTGISNLSFPRTDPTVIMAVVSPDGQRILLGRQKRWPPHWYSTLAGFLEPAESVEEAVRREVWEESGIFLGRVVIHSTQPWPYPANLMIGAIGQAIPEGETVHLGHDAELEDARWFSVEEVREALRVGTSGLGDEAGPEYKEGAETPAEDGDCESAYDGCGEWVFGWG
ncbi:NADH pyrophosphatase [Coniosporium tulheliwenetii]|uniref:NADH pyrophosphatase n=1 Tax=Coniosporium tulheliwenetii TaxID=3383036 RepID=A0ACC2YXE9_9PEZI|nr:NADH pyrophosphatase [Cladosporium sp. JES 115]